jgi:hypothetical protein
LFLVERYKGILTCPEGPPSPQADRKAKREYISATVVQDAPVTS